MATNVELALMAGASYISSRSPINKFPVPEGWSENIEDRREEPSGFEATYFTRGNELVISFTGTQPGWEDWRNGNIPLANGVLATQLEQAADYYLSIKAANAATITLTGHSLGGGLAALIAVMFDERAVSFDQAPFRNSALFYDATDANGLPTMRSVAQNLRAYLEGRAAPAMLARLDAYIIAGDRFNPDPIHGDTLAGREAKVINYNVQNEILSSLPYYSRIGVTPQRDIPNHGPANEATCRRTA